MFLAMKEALDLISLKRSKRKHIKLLVCSFYSTLTLEIPGNTLWLKRVSHFEFHYFEFKLVEEKLTMEDNSNTIDLEGFEDNVYIKHFLPMIISCSSNQPERYWEMNYTEQIDKFFSQQTEEEQVVCVQIFEKNLKSSRINCTFGLELKLLLHHFVWYKNCR